MYFSLKLTDEILGQLLFLGYTRPINFVLELSNEIL